VIRAAEGSDALAEQPVIAGVVAVIRKKDDGGVGGGARGLEPRQKPAEEMVRIGAVREVVVARGADLVGTKLAPNLITETAIDAGLVAEIVGVARWQLGGLSRYPSEPLREPPPDPIP
jgi:hypothetical protein